MLSTVLSHLSSSYRMYFKQKCLIKKQNKVLMTLKDVKPDFKIIVKMSAVMQTHCANPTVSTSHSSTQGSWSQAALLFQPPDCLGEGTLSSLNFLLGGCNPVVVELPPSHHNVTTTIQVDSAVATMSHCLQTSGSLATGQLSFLTPFSF